MNIICPICSNNNFKKLLSIYHPDRFEIAVGIAANGYERFWYECLRCGVAINYHKKENLQKLESLSENYYEVDFGKINLLDRYNTIMKLPAHRSDNKGRVSRIKNFINNRSFLNYNFNGDEINKILDIGSIEYVKVIDIVNIISNELNKSAKIESIDCINNNYEVRNSIEVENAINSIGIDKKNYTEKLIKKYVKR
jgi:hypothetical protein